MILEHRYEAFLKKSRVDMLSTKGHNLNVCQDREFVAKRRGPT